MAESDSAAAADSGDGASSDDGGAESGHAALGATTLPQVPRGGGDRRRLRPALSAALAAVVIVVVVVVVLATRGPGTLAASGAHTGAVARGGPVVPVYAASGHSLADPAAVRTEVAALLDHRLPAAPERFATTTAAPAADALLGPSLALDDPALPGCVSALEDGTALLGIDRVSYAGQPSLLVVTTDDATPTAALAWVVGRRCSLPGVDGVRTVVTTTR